jgi:predicted transcriptional regulator
MRQKVSKMIKKRQESFYRTVGKALTSARTRRNMSIAELAKLSDEQNKTIRAIEKGSCCSLHHIVWMTEIFGMNFVKIVKEFEGKYEQEISARQAIDDII